MKLSFIIALIKKIIPQEKQPKMLRIRLLERLMRDEIIKAGPFAGIIFPTTSQWSGVVPKLLGVYESELYPTMDAWRRIAFATIINIGSADGYYALGCAKYWPTARILAYETEIAGKMLLDKYSSRNGFEEKIECRSTCTPVELGRLLKEFTSGLLIMDVEGYEDILLAGDNVALLERYFIIVELHDIRVDDLGEKLTARFTATHSISEIWTRARHAGDFGYPENLLVRLYLRAQLLEISNEERGAPMRWFVMEPKVINN